MSDPYRLQHYYLTLSTFAGIVFNASHWFCRIRWRDEEGKYQEENAEHGKGDQRTNRFMTKQEARRYGLRLVTQLSKGHRYNVVIEGSNAAVDPQKCLRAPGNLKKRLNILWCNFETLNGWDAPKDMWPQVQAICDAWERLSGKE